MVAHVVNDGTDQKAQRQRAFIQQLEKKNISVTRICHEEKVFFGLRAPSDMFEDYQYLLKVSDSCNSCGDERGSVTQATRIRIVNFILHHTYINTGENLEELLMKDVFETMFCLHERKKQNNLKKKWARWSGLFTGQTFYDIKSVSHLFDNEGTVAFAMFMAIWAPLMSEGKWEFIKDHANIVAVNRWVSLKLCEIEKTNSFAATERSFTVKMFTFQFFTLFSSLFYVAFFLGRINGHPGNYVRIAGWRLEECHPSGCLTDLFIQMAVIMLLKQTLNNIFEFTGPWLKSCLSRNHAKKLERKCGHCYRKACRDEQGCVEPCDVCKLRDWLRNYHLANTDAFSLFNEYLEMVVQFSFTTIFVAAFPLAPLLALINNIFEIRLDAIKMVRLERRLVPWKTNDIGVWTKVLEVIGVYRDYRSDEDYALTSQFWLVLAVRFAFVILFEHVVVVCKFIAAWFVPDNPTQVKNDRLHDKLARLKEEIR
ncbi:hypothetical protein FQN60_011479 [Etheostoma spectabile]|uniref:Anoctamin n=1 Tax=Etheostoma spectabile TaxID=54343 RepID=A0A5J5CCB5_9PERO|nr:hypothetical protein FQN60_011479 [Etheostoma spectabile]